MFLLPIKALIPFLSISLDFLLIILIISSITNASTTFDILVPYSLEKNSFLLESSYYYQVILNTLLYSYS